MIKNWQSHKKYLHFLKHCKARMDSSQRIRWRELRPIRKRLKSLNLDAAGVFMFPLYSSTGRPALNQPQILRSFILWFLLFRQGLVKLSLTEWVEKLKRDELYYSMEIKWLAFASYYYFSLVPNCTCVSSCASSCALIKKGPPAGFTCRLASPFHQVLITITKFKLASAFSKRNAFRSFYDHI